MDEITPLITIFGVFLANAVMIIPLFLWNYSQSRADFRQIEAKLEANRREMQANRQETNALIQSIQQGIKDFHGRLERVDADFKNHLMNRRHEGRNRGK